MTHTFVTMEVSEAAFDEIEAKMREAGYDHVFIDGAIDMHGIALTRMKERREIWAHLKGAPFAIRRFTTHPPLIEGAAYGTEMVERRKLPDRRSPLQHSDDTTGLCTVRDAVSLMFGQKSDVCEMYFTHDDKEWNVELRILRAEDRINAPNSK